MAIENKDIYKLASYHRFQWEEAQNCYVILFPEGMVKLNGGAGEVLKLVDGKNTVSSIIEELTKKFPNTPSLENDITGMIDMALEKAWVEKVN